MSDKDCFSKPHSNMTINVLKSDNFGSWKCLQIKSNLLLKELFFKLRKCQCHSIKVLFFQASFENSSSLEWFHRQPSVLSSFDQSEVAKSQISFAKLQVIRIKVLSALHIELQSWVHTEPTQSNKCPISDAFENPLDFRCFHILFTKVILGSES